MLIFERFFILAGRERFIIFLDTSVQQTFPGSFFAVAPTAAVIVAVLLVRRLSAS